MYKSKKYKKISLFIVVLLGTAFFANTNVLAHSHYDVPNDGEHDQDQVVDQDYNPNTNPGDNTSTQDQGITTSLSEVSNTRIPRETLEPIVTGSCDTYYVATTGSDSNPGTLNSPFASLRRAVEDVARACDTVIMRGGNYIMNEVFVDRKKGRGGAPGAYLTIKNYPGETPFLKYASRRFIVWADYVRIEGLHLDMPWYLDIFGRGNQVVNNTFTGQQPKFGAILGGGDNNLFEGNNIRLISGGNTMDHGIYVKPGKNIVVRNNTIQGSQGYGIQVYDEHKSSIPSEWAANPIVYNNLLIEGNIVSSSNERAGIIVAYGTNRGVQHITMKDITIRNNMLYNNVGNGIIVRNGEDIKIYNNTLYGNRAAAIYIQDSSVTGAAPHDIVVSNNIFDSSSTGEPRSGIVNDSRGANITANTNLYWPATRIFGVSDPGQVSVDPGFVNPSIGDFHLSASSSAIDSGLDLSSVTSDFEGTGRPKNSGYDIGADEYGSGTVLPPTPPPTVKTQCSDGVDNDNDGLVDMVDPGCVNANDDDESNLITPPPLPGGEEDTIKPRVLRFGLQRSDNVGQVIANFLVADRGGSYLNEVELYRSERDESCRKERLDECGWHKVAGVSAPSATNEWRFNFSDKPGQGSYWYGLQVTDGSGNKTTEKNQRLVVIERKGGGEIDVKPESDGFDDMLDNHDEFKDLGERPRTNQKKDQKTDVERKREVSKLQDRIRDLRHEVNDLEREFINKEKTLTKNVNKELTERLRGKILLQVGERGAAWYVDSISDKRFYLRDGNAAYNALHAFGLGVSDSDLDSIPVGIEDRADISDADGDGLDDRLEEAIGSDPDNKDSDNDGFEDGIEVKNGYKHDGVGYKHINKELCERLEGRILLQVERKGEAWYINNCRRYYLRDGKMAYQVMKFLSIGISDGDIRQLAVGDFEVDKNNDGL